MKLKISEKDKKLIIMLGLVIICGLFYQFAYTKIAEDLISVKSEHDLAKQELDIKLAKSKQIDEFDAQIIQLQNSLTDDSKGFYGIVPQATFTYYINQLRKQSNLDFENITFALSQAGQSEGYTPNEDEAVNGENIEKQPEDATTQSVQPEKSKLFSSIQMDGTSIPYFLVGVDSEGTFEEFKKLLNMVESNRKKVIIDAITFSKVDTNFIYFPGKKYAPPKEEVQTQGLLFDKPKSAPKTESDIIKDSLLLKAHIQFKFYMLPFGDTGEAETGELYKWYNKSSQKDPFNYYDFLASKLLKIKVHTFDSANYVTTSQGTGNAEKFSTANIVETVVDNGEDKEVEKNNLMLEYTFNENSSNPKIFIDLNDKNINLDAKATNLGINIFSGKINKSKIYLSLSDSAGAKHNMLLADSIYWEGWASIDKKIDPNIKGPVKVLGILIIQEGEQPTELQDGILKFDFMYEGYSIDEKAVEN